MKAFLKIVILLFVVQISSSIHAKDGILEDLLASKKYTSEPNFIKKAELLREIIKEGLETTDQELFQQETEKCFAHAIENDDDYLLNYTQYLMVYSNITTVHSEETIQQIQEFILYFQKVGDEDILGDLHRLKGICYYENGLFQLSLNSFQESQNHYKENKNDLEYTHSKALASKVLIHFKKYDQAEKNLKYCIQYMIKAKKYKGVYEYYSYLSDLYENQKNKKMVRYCNQKSVEYAQKSGSLNTIALSMNNLAIAKFYEGDIEGALEYFQKALEKRKLTGRKRNICESYYNIASVYDETKNYEKAIEYYKLSMNLAKEYHLLIDEGDACISLANVYEKTGDYKLSTQFNKQYIAIQEKLQINNLNASKTNASKYAAIENQKANHQNQLLKTKLTGEVHILKNRILVMWLGYLVLVLFVFLIIRRKRGLIHFRR